MYALVSKFWALRPAFHWSFRSFALGLLSTAILYVWAWLMLKGTGSSARFMPVAVLMVTLGWLWSQPKLCRYVGWPVVAVYALYAPIGFTYGAPTYQYIASVFATDLAEGGEFLKQVPLENFLLPVLIPLLAWSYGRLRPTLQSSWWHKRWAWLAVPILWVVNPSPLQFASVLAESTAKVSGELAAINLLDAPSAWPVSSVSDEAYEDYVLVIGESARRDYHHAYGYPLNNTPFMSAADGVLVDGLVAAGFNTVASLRLMLTINGAEAREPDYALNFVDLAKEAGFEVHWYSNQGYVGQFDTPITLIAKRSDSVDFLQASGDGNERGDDLDLLPRVQKRLQVTPPTGQRRLFVVHLYGSHPDACDRVKSYPLVSQHTDRAWGYINCYVSSIHKTDAILAKLHQQLSQNAEQNGRSFSMLYFSDHGLSHYERRGRVVLNQSRRGPLHYDIPLFVTSSDSTNATSCQAFKSGLNFTHGLGAWLKISNPVLLPEYSLFDCQDDADEHGLREEIRNNPDPLDPAVVLEN